MGLLLTAHTVGASFALLTGTTSLIARKGHRLHRFAGKVFVYSMLTMALSAVLLAFEAGKWLDVCSGFLTIYLVITSLGTVNNLPAWSYRVMPVLGFLTIVGYLWVEYLAIESGIRRPDVPAGAGFIFATLLAFSVVGDVKVMIRNTLNYQQKLTRHLWRMCFALLLSTVSFFLSRAHLFPVFVQETGVLTLLAVLPLLILFYWTVRIRFTA